MIDAFCKDLSQALRGHSFHEGRWWSVYCFADEAGRGQVPHAIRWREVRPARRGKGANWARWNRR
jgi:hypothetical protein